MTGISPQSFFQIKNDQWLSRVLKRNTYHLLIQTFNEEAKHSLGSWIRSEFRERSIFIYTKVSVHDTSIIHGLEGLGFRLVETNIKFKKTITANESSRELKHIRFAHPDDTAAVGNIAESAFTHSRFHLDPEISNTLSNRLKKEWVINFFEHKRGQAMVVAEAEHRIAGFLLLLFNRDDITIDLIAVDGEFQRKGMGYDMVEFVEKNINDQ